MQCLGCLPVWDHPDMCSRPLELCGASVSQSSSPLPVPVLGLNTSLASSDATRGYDVRDLHC